MPSKTIQALALTSQGHTRACAIRTYNWAPNTAHRMLVRRSDRTPVKPWQDRSPEERAQALKAVADHNCTCTINPSPQHAQLVAQQRSQAATKGATTRRNNAEAREMATILNQGLTLPHKFEFIHHYVDINGTNTGKKALFRDNMDEETRLPNCIVWNRNQATMTAHKAFSGLPTQSITVHIADPEFFDKIRNFLTE